MHVGIRSSVRLSQFMTPRCVWSAYSWGALSVVTVPPKGSPGAFIVSSLIQRRHRHNPSAATLASFPPFSKVTHRKTDPLGRPPVVPVALAAPMVA